MSYNERSPSPARGGGWGGGGEDEGRGGGGGARRSPLPPVGRREDDYPSSMGAQDGYGLPRRPRSPMDDDRRGNGGGGKRRRSPSPLPPSRSERDVYIPSYGRERSPPSYRDAGSRRGGPPPGSDYYGGGGYGGYGGYGSYGGGGGGYAYGGGYDRFDDRGSSSYGRDPYDPYAAPPSSRYDSQRLPPSTSRSSMKPPEDLSYLAPFSYYRDFMRDEDPRLYDDKDGLEESYTKYKRSFLYKANKELFAEIKGMSWCKERYGITQAEADDRRRLKIKGREGKLDAFLSALAKGEWDDLLLDQRVIAPPPTPAKRDARLLEVDSEGKVIDREVSAKAEGGDEEHKPAVKVEGTDEQSTDATMKEESNGADADQKPKVEGDGEGKSESAVPVAAKTEGESEGLAAAPAQNGAQDYQQQKRNEEDSILIPAAPNTLLIKTLPPDLSRADLEAHCSQVEGCDYVALAEPNPTKRFHRIGWVVFKPDADMASAVEKLCESKINNFTLHMDLAEKLTYQRMRVTPAAMGTPERTRETLAHIKQVSAKLEAQASEESPEEAKEDYSRGSAAIEARLAELRSRPKSETDTIKPETADDVDAVNAVEVERLEKLELDLHIQYLRSVFNVCYYCLYSADFPEELTKKCVKHVRRNLASPVGGKNRKEQEQAWIKNFDEKAILLLDREKANALDYGVESYQDELTRLCKDHIQVEDDSKFRCKTCKKLFKAAPFVEKHIMNKHPEVIGDKLDQLKYFNNFVLDPAHVSAPAEPTAYSMSGAPYPSGYGASAAYSGMASTFGAFNQMFNPSYGGGYGSMMAGAYPPLSGGYGASAPMFAAQPIGGAAGFSAGGYGGYGGGNLSGGARALGERIGDRGGNGYAGGYGAAAGIPAGPGSASKRQRRDPPAPPKGAKLDPRAGKLHAYTDLDGPPASGGGDDTMLDY